MPTHSPPTANETSGGIYGNKASIIPATETEFVSDEEQRDIEEILANLTESDKQHGKRFQLAL